MRPEREAVAERIVALNNEDALDGEDNVGGTVAGDLIKPWKPYNRPVSKPASGIRGGLSWWLTSYYI
jgi:hypothetical protein